jgi:hypothetical protein
MTTRTVRQRVTGETTIGAVPLWVDSCCVCGVIYAVTVDFDKARRSDRARFFCPNGHGQSYQGKTEEQKLRERLERAEQDRDRAEAGRRAATDQAAAAERSARAYRGHLTRLRNRIANGVCPCCNRSFANVRAHIAGQHPEWAAEHVDALQPGDSR